MEFWACECELNRFSVSIDRSFLSFVNFVLPFNVSCLCFSLQLHFYDRKPGHRPLCLSACLSVSVSLYLFVCVYVSFCIVSVYPFVFVSISVCVGLISMCVCQTLSRSLCLSQTVVTDCLRFLLPFWLINLFLRLSWLL